VDVPRKANRCAKFRLGAGSLIIDGLPGRTPILFSIIGNLLVLSVLQVQRHAVVAIIYESVDCFCIHFGPTPTNPFQMGVRGVVTV